MSNLVKAIDLRCRPNNANLLMSFIVASAILNFFDLLHKWRFYYST